MSGLRIGELCAGYNGLGLAVEEVFGATPVWFSEYDAAPSKILAHHYPNVPNYGDMTKIDWAAIEPVDIISGGTPCQDLSAAGRRAGMTEGTRSNLWVQMREAIAIQKPTYAVWENVRGAFSAKAASDLEHCPRCMGEAGHGGPDLRALGRVLGDLSDLGFDAEWRGVRASEVGACHQRYRVFVLARRTTANTAGSRRNWSPGQNSQQDGRGERSRRADTNGSNRASTEAWGLYEPAIRHWERVFGRAAPPATEPTGRNGGERLSARLVEWMMGLSDGWVTGVPDVDRAEQLRALGNGVVPQQAVAALSDMLDAFSQKERAA